MALGVTSSEPSSWNQQVYQRLKMAIALGLRRQIFLAVCDDKTQGSELAIALQTDADLSQSTCLASIQLLPAQRPVLEQIRQGLPQHRSGTGAVCLQLLGIAELTRQSANLQWSFLRQLREIPQQFLRIESESASECLGSLVFWISRPWLHQIQQSAPEFWRACTGVFEFCSEPLPISLSSPHSTSHHRTPVPTSAKPPAAPSPSERNPNRDRLPPQETVTISPSSRPDWQFVPKSLLQLVTITQDEVSGHHPLERLQQIEQLHRLGGNRDRLGVQYQELGNLYRDRLQQDCDLIKCARTGIAAYSQALQIWQTDPPNQPGRLLATFNDLGTLHWLLARHDHPDRRLRALQASVQAYQQAIASLKQVPKPDVEATLHHNLGSVWADIGRTRQQADDWQQAIAAFEAALTHSQTEPDHPSRHAQTASIQNNLGTAYWSLAQFRDPKACLQRAIRAYEVALTYYTCDRDEMTYAMLQSNLGTAYWTLSDSGQSPEMLQRAIAAYQEALLYRTPERFPAGCAATQNNLGTAYWHLAQQAPPEQALDILQQAITSYRTAIEVAQSQTSLSFDLYATHNNLGLTHYYLGMHPHCEPQQRLTEIETALDQHVIAFNGWRSQPQRQKAAQDAIVRTLRACYDLGGMTAQSKAFNRVPATLLPEIMGRL
ncbi:MAG: tetratricopeptide repeat protein [Phormidium sp. BM_Day4_Bin.17]|nr:tetratricopeptide repeat protein [Phormidium sp. BM_Day4_Bin.17]UCJ13261.1 MAG: tetratricopeptide repeat protein [Phormidium sp. PBR-2020]